MLYVIYIPIWIDLKGEYDNISFCCSMIYIPIWIDLKVTPRIFIAAIKVIYIPIWIDLKDNNRFLQNYSKHNLHSNMDRFESSALNSNSSAYSFIYIPIWIDLKVNINEHIAHQRI